MNIAKSYKAGPWREELLTIRAMLKDLSQRIEKDIPRRHQPNQYTKNNAVNLSEIWMEKNMETGDFACYLMARLCLALDALQPAIDWQEEPTTPANLSLGKAKQGVFGHGK